MTKVFAKVSSLSIAFMAFVVIIAGFGCLCIESQAQSIPFGSLNSVSEIDANNYNKTSVNVTTPSSLVAQQIAITFLNQVAGIDVSNYTIASFHASTSQVEGSQKLQTFITAIINDQQRELGVSMVLIEGKVRFYDLALLSGTLEGAPGGIAYTLSATKRAIDNYKTLFNASYCIGLSQLVPETVQTQNSTINGEDTILNVEYFGDTAPPLKSARLCWYRTNNGFAIPAQSIQAIVSKTGIVTSFADNLGLYKIATTNVAVTKEEAIGISIPYINAYAEENSRKIDGVSATLQYVSDYNSSRGDSYLIYPLWAVQVTFESSANDVFGYAVSVWADNGKVRYNGAQGIYQPVTANSSSFLASITIAAVFAVFATAVTIGCTLGRKKSRCKDKIFFKTISILALMAIVSVPVVIQPCLALPSTVFGTPYGVTDQDECARQRDITNYIANVTEDAGWTPYNWWGSNSVASNFYVGAYDHGEAGSLVFNIGHGQLDQNEYEMIDDTGTWVSNTSIYDNSVSQSSGHHKFALLWSCHLGEEIGGMPRAWLHTTALSPNGYESPDTSGQVFIGWVNTAPYITYRFGGVDEAGYYLLYGFYWAALTIGFNVNAALDFSAQNYWQVNFEGCPFCTQQEMPGRMVVYGQGNMYIGEKSYVTYIYNSYSQGGSSGVFGATNLIGAQNDGQFAHLHAGEPDSLAFIVGTLNTEANGHVEIYGYSGVGYATHLYVYVSNDGENFDCIGDQYITANSPYTIDGGYAENSFAYVGVAVYDDDGLSACLYVDAVHVRG